MNRPAVAALLLLAAGPAVAAERGFPVGSFDRVTVEGSADVVVSTGHGESVRASGDPTALDRLDVRVDGTTLKIGTKRGLDWSWRDHGPVRVAVAVPTLRAVDIAGSGSIAVDRVKTEAFAAVVAGSGSVTVAALDSDRASFVTRGSGSMTAAGRCGDGVARIEGSGDLKLAALKCTTLSASVAGSGSLEAFASRTATLATMGSGDITVTGGARCTTSTAGSGKIHCG